MGIRAEIKKVRVQQFFSVKSRRMSSFRLRLVKGESKCHPGEVNTVSIYLR